MTRAGVRLHRGAHPAQPQRRLHLRHRLTHPPTDLGYVEIKRRQRAATSGAGAFLVEQEPGDAHSFAAHISV